MRRITYTRAALKTLRKIPANTAKLIVSKVGQYAVDPASLANNVTELKGRTGFRLWVNSWRVIMNDDGTVLTVLESARAEAYTNRRQMMDTVTIDRAEYDRLTEAADELDDLRAYDRAMARLDTGEDELIPADAVVRLLSGESPVRVYRELRGFTQQQLADASNVNRVQIADIEARRKQGSIDTVKRLAAALEVAVDDLV